jgi:DNA-binding GntR family transcriptional regulator
MARSGGDRSGDPAGARSGDRAGDRRARLVRRSSGDEAARTIRGWIFHGELRPGERVPQDRVAEELGISRIPVREALIALDREGWVTLELHRGAFVNALDERAVRDHYELLGVVYGFATRQATLYRDHDSDEALVAIEEQLRRATTAGALYPLAVSFHAAIVAAARSPRIRALLRAMPPLVPGDFFELVGDALDRQREALLAIGSAIRAGDRDAASQRYVDMTWRNTQLVVEMFRTRGLFEATT